MGQLRRHRRTWGEPLGARAALGSMGNGQAEKTIIARLRRRMSSSSNRPRCTPTFDLATVVILSTINRQVIRNPLSSDGSEGL